MERSSTSLPPIRDLFGEELVGHGSGEASGTQRSELAVRSLRLTQDADKLQPQLYPQSAYRSGLHPVGVPLRSSNLPQGPSTEPSSRHSSVSSSTVRSYATSSLTSLVGECTSPSVSSSSDTDENGSGRPGRRRHNVSKNRKEKKHRADLALVMRTKQYAVKCYSGRVHGNEQSAGNAKSSGLDFNKLDIDNGRLAMSLRAFDRLLKWHLENGLEDDLREWFQLCQTEWVEHNDPTWGTLMYDPGPRCMRDDNGTCFTHGEPDYNKCCRARAEANFERNVELYLQECGRGSKKRRQA